MVPLVIQTAPTFMHKNEEYTHVLPCGHAVSEELGKRMAQIALPTNDLLMEVGDGEAWFRCLKGSRRRCWFCGSGFNSTDLKRLYYEDDGGGNQANDDAIQPHLAETEQNGNSKETKKRKREPENPPKPNEKNSRPRRTRKPRSH